MVGVQKMDIAFFLFDEITNHENWPFIDKILYHFDLQIQIPGTRQLEFCQNRYMCPKSHFLWAEVENSSRERQETYVRASTSEISSSIQFVCFLYLFRLIRQYIQQTEN